MTGMDYSDARAVFGLSCTGEPTSTGASGSLVIGSFTDNVDLPAVTTPYMIRAIIADTGSSLVVNQSVGTTSGSTAFTAGAAQVETATVTAASGCTSNGTMTLVVTAAGMTGSPKNVAVALTTTEHTTAALIAAAARTSLNADADVAAMFTAGGTGANITLTRKPTATFTVPTGTLNLYAANDGTINLAIPSGLGVTAAGTSTNTTAGVLSAGCKVYDGDGKDHEGETLPAISDVHAIRIKVENTGAVGCDFVTDSSTDVLTAGELYQRTSPAYGLPITTTYEFTPTAGPVDLTLTVFGL